MKNKNILFSSLIALLSISTLVGCGNDGNSSQTSKNEITSSIDPTLIAQRAELKSMLSKMKNGLRIEGNVTQQINLLDGYHGSKTGDTINIKYPAEYIYENGEERGFSSIVNYQEEGYPEESFINLQAYEGSDGYAYFDSLDYDNTIDRFPYYMGDQYVNYGYYCLNPFEYLLPEDFTKINENTYSLSKGKASFLASNIFGDISKAFEYAVKRCEFTVENGQFKSFVLEPVQYHDSLTDYENQRAIYYYADFVASFEFSDIGTAKVNGLKPREATDKTAELQAAFDMFKNKNYTVRLAGVDRLVNSDNITYEEHKLYEYYYYDGEDIFMNYLVEDTEDDPTIYIEENTMFSRPNSEGYMSGVAIPVKYDELAPKMSEVKAEIFDYNEETGLYSICKEMESYIASIAIAPKPSRFSDVYADYTTGFDIKLSEDGSIEYIDITYILPISSATTIYGEIRLEFYDIDNTKIPFGLKTYE